MSSWQDRVLGALPQRLADALTKGLPRRTHDGIELVFADSSREPMADDYFDRTVSALRTLATNAEEAYAGLKRDVRRIMFWPHDTGVPYHPFQKAIIVPPQVAQEPDLTCLAAWLAHVSQALDDTSPDERLAQFLRSLSSAEALRVSSWLSETMRRAVSSR